MDHTMVMALMLVQLFLVEQAVVDKLVLLEQPEAQEEQIRGAEAEVQLTQIQMEEQAVQE